MSESKRWFVKRLVLVLLIGCGGDADPDPADSSGVDPTLALGTILPGEIDELCAYGVELSREVICNGNATQSVTTLDGCTGLLEILADGCTATVDDMETCFEALSALTDEQVCGLENPAECEFLGDPSCVDI